MCKLVFRELKKNWFQFLSMLVITVLAVTLFFGFLSNSLTLAKRSELYFEEANVADLIVQTTLFEAEDADFFDASGATVEYRIYSDGSYRKGDQSPQTAEIFVADGEINKPYITEGKAGFLIDARVADLMGYEIGDVMTVEFSSFKEILEKVGLDCEFTFEVTGLMHSIERVNIYSTSPVFLTPGVLIGALADASGYREELVSALLTTVYNQAVLQCDEPERLKADAESYFAGKEKNNLIFVYDRDTMEAVVTIDEEVVQSLNMLYVFPVIFFFVALLVIMSTASRLILRERINIGTMKALGIGNGLIVFHYAFLSTFVTFLGCVIGAVVGPAIVPNVMGIKYTLMFSMPLLSGIVVSVPWTALTILFVCACSAFIGVWVSRSVIKENPAECMRPKQISYRPRVKRGTGKQGARATHALLSCRMALRNLRINWGRAVMTAIGILGCSALLLTSFGIGDTLDASIKNDLGGLFYYDVAFSYSSSQEEEIFGSLDRLVQAGEVSSYEQVHSYVVTVPAKSETISVWVFEADSACTSVTAGGNTLSQNKAEEFGLAVGDEITFTAGTYVVSCKVDAIVQTSVWNGFFTTENPFDESCYSTDTVWVRTDDADGAAASLGELGGILSVQTREERLGEIQSMISSTNMMKYTLMVFAVLLSVVVLYNLSLLNMKERMRDMATLKVLGYTHFQIALSLILEIMTLTVLGTAIGCAFGYPLLWLVMKMNEISIMSFLITLQPVSYVMAVAISLGTAIVINLIFGFLISGINMTESLKSVE